MEEWNLCAGHDGEMPPAALSQVLDLDGLSLLSPPRGILAGGVGLTRAWLGRLREAQGGRRLDLSSLGLDGAEFPPQRARGAGGVGVGGG